MKVEIKVSDQVNVKPFPKLMISKDGDLVLFESEQKGMYLKGTNYEKPHYCNNWHMNNFKDFEGSITLSND